jgi:predicted metal-binding membrane protein
MLLCSLQCQLAVIRAVFVVLVVAAVVVWTYTIWMLAVDAVRARRARNDESEV